MGFFENLEFYAMKMRELGDICKEFGQDMHEILTDGVEELVINNKSEYQTSMEKREKANEIIKTTDRIRENKRYDAEKQFSKAELLQQQVIESRCSLLNEIKTASVTYAFAHALGYNNQPFCINDSKKVDILCSFNDSIDGIPFYDIIRGNSIPYYSKLASIDNTHKDSRVNAANELLECAEDYSVQIDQLCTEIDYHLVQLSKITANMNEELEVHNIIRSALKSNNGFKGNDALNMLKSLNYIGVNAPEYISSINKIKRSVKV